MDKNEEDRLVASILPALYFLKGLNDRRGLSNTDTDKMIAELDNPTRRTEIAKNIKKIDDAFLEAQKPKASPLQKGDNSLF